MPSWHEDSVAVVLFEPMGGHARHEVLPSEHADGQCILFGCQVVVLFPLHILVDVAHTLVHVPYLVAVGSSFLVFVVALEHVHVGHAEAGIQQDFFPSSIFLRHEATEAMADDQVHLVFRQETVDLRESLLWVDGQVRYPNSRFRQVFTDKLSCGRFVALSHSVQKKYIHDNQLFL